MIRRMQVTKIRILLTHLLSGAVLSWGQQGLRLEARAGDGAFNDISRSETNTVIVAVRDSSDRPVPGAKVKFTLPFAGPGAAFAGGGREVTTTSDPMGLAKMTGAKPNREEGRFNIKVSATTDDGRSGSLVVSQSNTSAVASKAKTSKTLLILSLIGGGATAAILAAKGGGAKTTGAGGTTPIPVTSLSVGVLTVGAPR